MEPKPNDKPSLGSAAIVAVLSAGAGAGIGWLIWITTANNAVAIGMAGPVALLASNFLRRVIT